MLRKLLPRGLMPPPEVAEAADPPWWQALQAGGPISDEDCRRAAAWISAHRGSRCELERICAPREPNGSCLGRLMAARAHEALLVLVEALPPGRYDLGQFEVREGVRFGHDRLMAHFAWKVLAPAEDKLMARWPEGLVVARQAPSRRPSAADRGPDLSVICPVVNGAREGAGVVIWNTGAGQAALARPRLTVASRWERGLMSGPTTLTHPGHVWTDPGGALREVRPGEGLRGLFADSLPASAFQLYARGPLSVETSYGWRAEVNVQGPLPIDPCLGPVPTSGLGPHGVQVLGIRTGHGERLDGVESLHPHPFDLLWLGPESLVRVRYGEQDSFTGQVATVKRGRQGRPLRAGGPPAEPPASAGRVHRHGPGTHVVAGLGLLEGRWIDDRLEGDAWAELVAPGAASLSATFLAGRPHGQAHWGAPDAGGRLRRLTFTLGRAQRGDPWWAQPGPALGRWDQLLARALPTRAAGIADP